VVSFSVVVCEKVSGEVPNIPSSLTRGTVRMRTVRRSPSPVWLLALPPVGPPMEGESSYITQRGGPRAPSGEPTTREARTGTPTQSQ
jgi:hypothetical protein